MARARTPQHRRSRRARFASRQRNDRTRPRDVAMEQRAEQEWQRLREQGADETDLRAYAGDR